MHPAPVCPRLQHPAAAGAALSREGVCELLLAALQLELDPSANQLQEQLGAGEGGRAGRKRQSQGCRRSRLRALDPGRPAAGAATGRPGRAGRGPGGDAPGWSLCCCIQGRAARGRT